MRRKTAAAAAAGALGLAVMGGVGGIGIGSALTTTASAQTAPSPSEEAPDDAAPEPGEAAPDDATRTAERTTRITDALADLVAAGTITAEQADAVAETLASSDALRGPGGGPGGPGGVPGLGVLHKGLETAAETLGLTEDELRAQLEGGATLGEVADGAGVDRSTLVDALVTVAQEHLAERVAAGDLTQERADEISADLTTQVTEWLDRALPDGGPGHQGGRDDGDA